MWTDVVDRTETQLTRHHCRPPLSGVFSVTHMQWTNTLQWYFAVLLVGVVPAAQGCSNFLMPNNYVISGRTMDLGSLPLDAGFTLVSYPEAPSPPLRRLQPLWCGCRIERRAHWTVFVCTTLISSSLTGQQHIEGKQPFRICGIHSQ